MSLIELADHIMWVANDHRLGVTLLHLHLTVYFTLVEGFKEGLLSEEEVIELYDYPFEASCYGPKVEELNHRYGGWASANIIAEGAPDTSFDKLNPLILFLLETHTSSLVRKSQQHGVWRVAYEYYVSGIRTPFLYRLSDLKDAASNR